MFQAPDDDILYTYARRLVLELVLPYLSVEDLLKARCVNREWRSLLEKSYMWRHATYRVQGLDAVPLRAFLLRAPLLKNIVFPESENPQPDLVNALGECCSDLWSIDLSRLPVSLEDMKRIFPKRHTNLQSCALFFKDTFTLECIRLLGDKTNLKRLKLCGFTFQYPDVTLESIADYCKQVTHYDIAQLKTKGADLDIFLQKTKDTLVSIRMNDREFELDDSLPFSACTKLKHVTYVVVSDNENILRVFKEVPPNLEVLQISLFASLRSAVQETFFKTHSFSNLLCLRLRQFNNMSQELALNIIDSCPHIKSLALANCFNVRGSVTDGVIKLLKLPLEQLEISDTISLRIKEWMNDIMTRKTVKYLDIKGTYVTNKVVAHIIVNMQPYYLNISRCENVSDAALDVIDNWPTVKDIVACNTRLSENCRLNFQRKMSKSVRTHALDCDEDMLHETLFYEFMPNL